MDVLTKDNKRFGEFIQKLEPLAMGCKCNLDGAQEVMRQMGSINIPHTIKYFEKNGAHCDCEIIYNIVLKEAA